MVLDLDILDDEMGGLACTQYTVHSTHVQTRARHNSSFHLGL